MSSIKLDPKLYINLIPSFRAFVLVSFLALGALGCVMLVDLPLLLLISLCLSVLVVYVRSLVVLGWVDLPVQFRSLLNLDSFVHTIRFLKDQQCLLQTKKGDLQARLHEERYINRNLVLLNFKLSEAKRISILICNDSLDSGRFRELRVYLKGLAVQDN